MVLLRKYLTQSDNPQIIQPETGTDLSRDSPIGENPNN